VASALGHVLHRLPRGPLPHHLLNDTSTRRRVLAARCPPGQLVALPSRLSDASAPLVALDRPQAP
jgi:hypothetical protein